MNERQYNLRLKSERHCHLREEEDHKMEAAIIGNISNIELVFRTCQNSKFNNAENKPIKKDHGKK